VEQEQREADIVSQYDKCFQEQQEFEVVTTIPNKRRRCCRKEVRDPPPMWLPPAATAPPRFVGSAQACAVAAQFYEEPNQEWSLHESDNALSRAPQRPRESCNKSVFDTNTIQNAF
jgi:hypothetical protein